MFKLVKMFFLMMTVLTTLSSIYTGKVTKQQTPSRAKRLISAMSGDCQGCLPQVVVVESDYDFLGLKNIPSGTLVLTRDDEKLYIKLSDSFVLIPFGRERILLNAMNGMSFTKEMPTDLDDLDKAQTMRTLASILPRERVLHIYAANAPRDGNMGGLTGADFTCFREAKAAKLTGTYKSFLSFHAHDLHTLITSSSDTGINIVNAKGEVIAPSWNDLFKGKKGSFTPGSRIFSFSGFDVLTNSSWPVKSAWHGSDQYGVRKEEEMCNAWNSDASSDHGIATPLQKNILMGTERQSCNKPLILLCVEISSGHKKYNS